MFCHINIIYKHAHFFFLGSRMTYARASFANLANWISLCHSLPPSVTFQKQGSSV